MLIKATQKKNGEMTDEGSRISSTGTDSIIVN